MSYDRIERAKRYAKHYGATWANDSDDEGGEANIGGRSRSRSPRSGMARPGVKQLGLHNGLMDPDEVEAKVVTEKPALKTEPMFTNWTEERPNWSADDWNSHKARNDLLYEKHLKREEDRKRRDNRWQIAAEEDAKKPTAAEEMARAKTIASKDEAAIQQLLDEQKPRGRPLSRFMGDSWVPPRVHYDDGEWDAWEKNSWTPAMYTGQAERKWGSWNPDVDGWPSDDIVPIVEEKKYTFAVPGMTRELSLKLEKAEESNLLVEKDITDRVLKHLIKNRYDVQKKAVDRFVKTFHLNDVRNKPGLLLNLAATAMQKEEVASLDDLNKSVKESLRIVLDRQGIKIEAFENKCLGELKSLPEELQLKCCSLLGEAKLATVRSPTGFFIGVIRRVREEGEMMGLIESRNPNRKHLGNTAVNPNEPQQEAREVDNGPRDLLQDFHDNCTTESEVAGLASVTALNASAKNGTLDFSLLPQMVKMNPEWLPTYGIGRSEALYMPLQSMDTSTELFPPALKVCKLTSITKQYTEEMTRYYQAIMSSMNQPQEDAGPSVTRDMAPHVELKPKIRVALDGLYKKKFLNDDLKATTIEEFSELPNSRQLYVIDEFAMMAQDGNVQPSENTALMNLVKHVRGSGIPQNVVHKYM